MRDFGPRFMGILESVNGILNDISVNGSDGFSLSEYEEVVRLESVLREFVGRVRGGEERCRTSGATWRWRSCPRNSVSWTSAP